jgi:1-phosphatidylinositol-4-phosphate 5-kinase
MFIRRSPSPSSPSRTETHKLSFVSSSAGSYRTAPLGNSASSFISSHSASNTTSASPHQRDSTGSPIYALTQEIHIVKVTNDMVQIEPGSDWVNKRAVYQPDDGVPVGPPPPSPPASVERREEEYFSPPIPPPPRMTHPVHSEPLPNVEHEHDRPVSTSTMASSQFTRTLSPTRDQVHRSSTDTNASYRTPRTTLTPASTPQLQSAPPSAFPQASSSKTAAHLSVDGYLQPPSPTSAQRPTRRNTTGSTSVTQKRSPSHAKGASQPFGTVDDAVLGEGGIELASDIEIHAEKIRRERMSKRAKQQQEAEAALTRAAIDVKEVMQDTPLVGNLIGEGHVNYVLMYNMLTGIRIGVRPFLFLSIYGYSFFFLLVRCRGVRRKSSDRFQMKILQRDTSFHSTCSSSLYSFINLFSQFI